MIARGRIQPPAWGLASAFVNLTDNGLVGLPPNSVLEEFAGADSMPSANEARTCALVYAQLTQTQG